jgi:hypothetical protein
MPKTMQVLDVGLSHCADYATYNEDFKQCPCQLRLAHSPCGYWYCIDCGRAILVTSVEIKEEKVQET